MSNPVNVAAVVQFILTQVSTYGYAESKAAKEWYELGQAVIPAQTEMPSGDTGDTGSAEEWYQLSHGYTDSVRDAREWYPW